MFFLGKIANIVVETAHPPSLCKFIYADAQAKPLWVAVGLCRGQRRFLCSWNFLPMHLRLVGLHGGACRGPVRTRDYMLIPDWS